VKQSSVKRERFSACRKNYGRLFGPSERTEFAGYAGIAREHGYEMQAKPLLMIMLARTANTLKPARATTRGETHRTHREHDAPHARGDPTHRV
jgi:hypothetical protein